LYYVPHERMVKAIRALCIKSTKKNGYRINDHIRTMILQANVILPDTGERGALAHLGHITERSDPSLFLKGIKTLEGLASIFTLNEVQRKVVLSALVNRLTLVQGPPGTGKTYVACAIVDAWCRSGTSPPEDEEQVRRKVLVISNSNVAARNVYTGIMANPAFRSYPDRVCIVSSKEGHERKYPPVPHEEMMLLVKKADIVVSTSIHIGGWGYDHLEFPDVIIDEASQGLEASLLVGLCRGAKRLVVIGDQFQLPPTIKSTDAYRNGMGISLLERWYNDMDRHENSDAISEKLGFDVACRYRLNEQRRMHRSLCAWPSKNIYNGTLTTPLDFDVADIPNVILPNVYSRIVVIDTSQSGYSQEKRDQSMSFYNDHEIEHVQQIIGKLLQRNIDGDRIGFISPYAAQQRALEKYRYRVEANSIDGFQGREKDIIICSMVRTNQAGRIGFVADRQRMNVMLTRARQLLVMVINIDTFLQSKNNEWINWINCCRTEGCIIEDWSSMF